MANTNWYDLVPKVELHLHLEGAIPLPAMWELIQKYGGDPSTPDFAALERRFEYRDFAHFIDTWIWHCGFIREYDDFTLIAESVARNLTAQNIRYAEVFYSPADFRRAGLTVQGITEAIRRGLDRAPQVEVELVADLVRDAGPEQAALTLAQVNEVMPLGVVGITIGGSEQTYPPEPFEGVYQEARRLGLHTSAHAGEAAGAESIWGAINCLRVDRIGHGTRAAEDPSLVAYLARRCLPLEVCPLSNVRTGVVPSLSAHPIRAYFEQGLVVTVSTDDPGMFGNSLAEEYRLLVEELGFTRREICALILNAARSSWLPEARKQELVRSLESDPAWLAA